MRFRRGALTILLGLLVPAAALPQVTDFPVGGIVDAPAFLVVDQERVLRESLFGQDLRRTDTEEADLLRAEAEALDRAFEAEELELTEKRPTLPPDEFRALADAFDEKVVRTRQEQQNKANALAQRSEQRQRALFQRLAPVLLAILTETGASAVVDQRTLLIAKGDLNITDEVIKRLDDVYRQENPDGPADPQNK